MLISSPSPHSHLHPHHHRHIYTYIHTCHQRYFSLFSHLVILLLFFLSFSPYLDAQDSIDYTTPSPSSTSTSTFPNITDYGNTTNTTLTPPPKNDTRVSNKSYTYQFLISMLVPITGSSLQIQFGLPQRAATEMAITEINSRNDLLKNVNLRLEYKDTGGSSGTAFFRSLEVCEFCAGPSTPNTTSRSVVIIGPSYTSEATSAAFVASKCNLTIVGTSPTSNTLADPITYPTYSRVIPNDLFQAEIAARFCAAFGWKRVATLSSALQAPADLINNFASNAVMYNVSIQLSTSYPANISSASDAEPALQLIRQSRARIIVLSGSSADSIFVFEAAKRMGMTKPPYVWFCIGGIVNAASAATNYANAPNIIGLTNYVNTSAPAYTSWVNRWTSSNFTNFGITTPNLQAAYQYDGVYLIAYALDRIMRGIEDCNNVFHPDYTSFICQYYRNDTFARQTPYAAVREYLLLILRNTTFNGVTGLVRLSPTGERKGSYSINSLNSSNGWVEVGYYTTTGQLILHQSIIWPDGTTTVPRDASLIIPTVVTISDEAYSAMSILAAAGIVVIFAYLIFNITRRHLPIIRLSSPRINTVALLGSVPAFICVFLLGIDTDEKHDFTLICQLRLWLLSMAFTATFGSLFAKTLRVQQIFRRANSLVAAKIHDWQLLVVVVFFLCIDVLLLGIWTIIDPLRHTVVHLDLRPHPNNNDIFYAPILNTCDCSSPLLWFGLLFCYKGILLLFGAYIAFDIRHVQVEALNDSRWIGFSIYNVAVLTLIIVPASFLLSDNAHETIYIISCTGIVVMAVATTSLMFLPKIILSRGTNQWNTNQPNTMMDDGHGSIDTSVMKNNTGISTLDTMLNVNPSRIRQLESEIFALRRRLLKYEEDLDKDDIPYATKPNVSGKQNSSHGTGTNIPAIPMQTLNKDKQLPPAPVNGKYSPPINGKYSPAPNGKYSPAPIPSPSPDTTQPVIRHFTSQRGRFRVPSSAKKHIVKDDISHDTIQEPTIIPDPTETNTPFTSTPPLPDSTSTSTLLQPISGTNTPMVGASPTLMSDSLASRTHSEHWRPGETRPTYMITENTPPVSSVENTP